MSQENDQIQLLKGIFRDDLESFGQYFFKHHLKLPTPQFHREIFKMYEDPLLMRIALAAPRG